MNKSLRCLALGALFTLAGVAKADIYDRIDECETRGGGACVYDLLRELASQSSSTNAILNAGTYTSDAFTITISATQNAVTIDGATSVSERGTYACTGTTCTGPQYSFTVNNRDQITMNYGRVWLHRP